MANVPESVNPEPTIESLPDSPIAGAPAGQSLEQAGDSSVNLEKLLSHPDFEALLDKKVQSVKDVRFGRMETEVKDLRGAIAKYDSLVASGVPKEQAIAQMEGSRELQDIRDQLAQVLSGNVAAPSPGGGEKSWGERQQAILDNAGIDKSDPRITELLKTSNSKQDFIAKLEEQTFTWKQADVNKPQPSAGSVAQTIPAVPSGDGGYTKEKYAEDMLANRGNKTRLNEIKAQARADGVDIDNIGFNL